MVRDVMENSRWGLAKEVSALPLALVCSPAPHPSFLSILMGCNLCGHSCDETDHGITLDVFSNLRNSLLSE